MSVNTIQEAEAITDGLMSAFVEGYIRGIKAEEGFEPSQAEKETAIREFFSDMEALGQFQPERVEALIEKAAREGARGKAGL